MFFIDMIVSFRTTFVDERTGIEIIELKSLAKNYL